MLVLELVSYQIAVNSDGCFQKRRFYLAFGLRMLELLRFWSLEAATLL